jgi:hypothetical protein
LKEETEMTKERCRAGGWTQYLKIAIANRVYAGFGELIDEARNLLRLDADTETDSRPLYRLASRLTDAVAADIAKLITGR